MVGMSKNCFQMDSFLILSSITIVIVILSIFLTFLWRNTSNFFNVSSRNEQLSHPHRSRLLGIAQKNGYFEKIVECVVNPNIVERYHCGGSSGDSMFNAVIILQWLRFVFPRYSREHDKPERLPEFMLVSSWLHIRMRYVGIPGFNATAYCI